MSEQIEDRRREGSTIERHASTIGIAIIIAILMWVGNSILAQGAQQGIMSGDIRVMASKIANLQAVLAAASNDRYTGTEASRNKSEVDRRFNRVEKRIDALEDIIRNAPK